MIDYERITKLFKSKAAECKTMDEFYKLFTSNDIEITKDETVELIKAIAEQKQRIDNCEITEQELSNVSGGFVLTGIAAVAACVGFGADCIGSAAVSAYVAYSALDWGYGFKSKK